MPPIPPIPAPPPDDPTDARPAWKRYAAVYLPWLVTLVMSFVATWLAAQPAKVQVERVEVPAPPVWLAEPGKPLVADSTGEARPTSGWVRDEAAIAANLDPLKTDQFADTPAGKAVQGDEDVFMWRTLRKVANRGPPWFPNIDQGQVGSCVGAGHAHGAMHVLATAIANGQNFEWKPISAEVIYGGSRVEVGGGKIRGDGSVGAWAVRWLRDFGLVPAEVVEGIDLTTYSAARAREFGRTGVPAALEKVAKQFPVKGSALVKSAADVNRAIHQSYPVTVCSDQGFAMGRDATGTCRASGTWFHCMVIIGYRHHPVTGVEQFFILNSWGNSAHTGPCVPDDAPLAGFWANADVVDRMVRQGDSFALADVVGFPARSIDWGFGAVVPRPGIRPAAMFGAFTPALAH